MAHIDLENGSQFSLLKPFDSASIPANGDYTGKKRALLIGIRKSYGYADLDMAHDDVYEMRDLLVEVYHYEESEVTILLDDGAHVLPTRDNILAAIAVFVKNVKAGDRLCFHYSGHSRRWESSYSYSSEQPDDLMTCLVPCDGEQMKILNTELRDILVQPLPAGSRLVAILDASHSGSLLGWSEPVFYIPMDTKSSAIALKHYRCNRVYVPWVWRGRRDNELIRNSVVRRGARLVSLPQTLRSWLARPLPTHLATSKPRQQSNDIRDPSTAATVKSSLNSRFSSTATNNYVTSRSRRTTTTPLALSSPLTRLRPGRKLTFAHLRSLSSSLHDSSSALTEMTDKETLTAAEDNWILHEEQDRMKRCESPEDQLLCNGWCRNQQGGSTLLEEVDDAQVDVISLASCKDQQPVWDAYGFSMTSVLVDLLRDNPERSLQDLLIQISHATYPLALSRHSRSKNYKAQRKNHTSIRHIKRLEPDTHPTLPAGEQTTTLKQGLRDSRLHTGYDMGAFQNPELSSPQPLDMNRPWRM
ncbi:Metacaspase type II [Favolaschia claudopus]|uniref:Metacaspase type II n=1 Tax=Favolaschia claudopus TaxID=2862362 RepID=A0AAW0A6Y1_9AGAR